MKTVLKSLLLPAVFSLLIFSCDSKMMTDVSMGNALQNEGHTLTDWDFTLAAVDNNDLLHFEFVTTSALNPATPVTFRDQAGDTVAAAQVGDTNASTGNIDGRSFVYSIPLEDFKSASLVNEVIIGS